MLHLMREQAQARIAVLQKQEALEIDIRRTIEQALYEAQCESDTFRISVLKARWSIQHENVMRVHNSVRLLQQMYK